MTGSNGRCAAMVDVAYFGEADLSESSQSACLARLREIEPDIPWEVVNQAGVHL